jgi:hypothetical protein
LNTDYCRYITYIFIHKLKWPESASKLYRPSDRCLSVKLAATSADREESHSQRGGSPTAVISIFLDRCLHVMILNEAEGCVYLSIILAAIHYAVMLLHFLFRPLYHSSSIRSDTLKHKHTHMEPRVEMWNRLLTLCMPHLSSFCNHSLDVI